MVTLIFIAKLLIYVVVARLVLRSLNGSAREAIFALVNLAAFYVFFIAGSNLGDLRTWGYIPVFLFIYAMMHFFSDRKNGIFWLAFLAPICVLVVLRYTPASWYVHFSPNIAKAFKENSEFSIAVDFLGISYLAFRCSYLVLEVRNGIVKKPGFWEYLGFCFFVPTMAVGPINQYSNYRRGFAADAPAFSDRRSLLRVIVGCVKFLFLGNVFNQLTYLCERCC